MWLRKSIKDIKIIFNLVTCGDEYYHTSLRSIVGLIPFDGSIDMVITDVFVHGGYNKTECRLK